MIAKLPKAVAACFPHQKWNVVDMGFLRVDLRLLRRLLLVEKIINLAQRLLDSHANTIMDDLYRYYRKRYLFPKGPNYNYHVDVKNPMFVLAGHTAP